MTETVQKLVELQAATRPRLPPEVVKHLRDRAELWELVGNAAERQMSHGLAMLLDMHDRLEAIRHGS